jgi:small-conductance mechanosensitive channel
MTPFLTQEFLGNPVRAWLSAIGASAATWLVLKLVAGVLVRRLSGLAGKTRTTWDDVIIYALHHTRGAVLVLVAVYAGSLVLELPARAVDLLAHLAVIALLIQIGIWLSAGVRRWVELSREQRAPDDAAAVMTTNVVGIVFRIALWSMVLLLGLDNLGVDVTALVAGLGVGGIAVALAAQSILGDLFASVSIVLDRPFVLGDSLAVDDLVGRVEEIGLKTTRLRSVSGEQLVFSNTDLLNSRIRNYGRMFERRVVLELGVTYHTSHAHLQEIPGMVKTFVEEHGDRVRFERAHFARYGDTALIFETVYYVLSSDYKEHMDIQQAINLAIHQHFEDAGIEFAYPTQTLFVQRSDTS